MTKVLFAASEAVPYIKTGGLADVTGSLPAYFDRTEVDARIILPKYACMDAKWRTEIRFLCHFYVDLGWRKQYAGLFVSEYQGVKYYFIDNEFYFGGPQPYHLIHEDMEKFAYFSKAVLEALRHMDFVPDIIHCHDWQTGLLPVYLDTLYRREPLYQNIRTVFTIHNLKFQGRWHLKGMQDMTGLPEYLFTSDFLEFYGEGNCLKGGVLFSDYVTTVSPSYAREITTPEGGEGMDGLFRSRGERLVGIINGIDTREFDPETDPLITEKYAASDPELFRKKEVNKQAFQEAEGLRVDPGVFLIGIVSRMTDQKGFDIIDYILEELLASRNFQLAVLGTGESRFEEAMLYFKDRYPDRITATIGYSEEKAHRIYASCDAFLMPSLFEPCGLSQLISMRYGTTPIVRETGGLIDTVQAYNEYEKIGTGFSFNHYNAHEMYGTILYARDVFKNHHSEWEALVRRMMSVDFSWGASARKYEELYRRLS